MVVAAAVDVANEDLIAVAAAAAAAVEMDSPLIGTPLHPLCMDDATAAAAAVTAAMYGTNAGILRLWVCADCTVRPALD